MLRRSLDLVDLTPVPSLPLSDAKPTSLAPDCFPFFFLLKRNPAKRAKPTWNRFEISANCGEWQMALKLFDSLFKAGLMPDARTYSAVMIACFKGHQVCATINSCLLSLSLSLSLLLLVMLLLMLLLVLCGHC